MVTAEPLGLILTLSAEETEGITGGGWGELPGTSTPNHLAHLLARQPPHQNPPNSWSLGSFQVISRGGVPLWMWQRKETSSPRRTSTLWGSVEMMGL